MATKRACIFLDVDGVLVNRKSLMGERNRKIGDRTPFDPDCVMRFNKIIDAIKPMPYVVLSSTWRTLMTLDEFGRFARRQGIYVPILEHTPILHLKRGYEIQAWLEHNKDVTHMCILDDDNDMVHLSPYLVNTTFEIGLEDKHVEEAIKLLS